MNDSTCNLQSSVDPSAIYMQSLSIATIYTPQWLHLRPRANNKLNSLLHFLQDISERESMFTPTGGGPLSSGMPPTASDI